MLSRKKGDAAAGWLFHSGFLQPPQSWDQPNSAVPLSFCLRRLGAEVRLTTFHICPLEVLVMLTKVVKVGFEPGTVQLKWEACFKNVFLLFVRVALVLRN